MERVGEDTVVSVEESDDEEGENGSASKLGGCPNNSSSHDVIIEQELNPTFWGEAAQARKKDGPRATSSSGSQETVNGTSIRELGRGLDYSHLPKGVVGYYCMVRRGPRSNKTSVWRPRESGMRRSEARCGRSRALKLSSSGQLPLRSRPVVASV